ncbi:hypothetical protein [Streptomyces lonarensis]|uniref:hypothetical protein n=1 Tax=Streptomyces lonarensis TaxID=700599 RepID=UPI001ADD9A61|nr:hypothetical protein [Streptomyces lonarensis]
MPEPDVVFASDPRRGLVARSGWEREEARTVLRDLGWEWNEELHALVPPSDAPEPEAGVLAVEELHRHGHRTGYAVGPYGATRLTLGRAEVVFTRFAEHQATQAAPDMPEAVRETTTGARGHLYERHGGPFDHPSLAEPGHEAPPL